MKQEQDAVKTVSSGNISDSNSDDDLDLHYNFLCDVVCGPTKTKETSNSLLVDSGATSHIVCNKAAFISFDKDYDPADHYVELADGTRTNGMIKGRGRATFKVFDTKGIVRKITVNKALYIPSYSINIFSVKKA